ncbi:hypothetical protein HaLaN_18100, partial [Haematococcus lacustris]
MAQLFAPKPITRSKSKRRLVQQKHRL